MTYHLTITQKPAYLHAIVTGGHSKANVVGFLRDVLRECADRHCFKVLIEERLEGPGLELLDVFKIVSRGSIEASGTDDRCTSHSKNLKKLLTGMHKGVASSPQRP